MENQISLFDQVYLDFHDCFCEKPERPKLKATRKVNKAQRAATPLDSLLPYLFPEDFPELQQQIDSLSITWTDEDIDLLEREILFSTINVLLDYRSAVKSRDEAFSWLMNDDVAPFSYRVCVRAMGARAEAFRAMVWNRLASERRALRQAKTWTKRVKAYKDWIEQLVIPSTEFEDLTGIESLAWHDELDEIDQRVASQSGYF